MLDAFMGIHKLINLNLIMGFFTPFKPVTNPSGSSENPSHWELWLDPGLVISEGCLQHLDLETETLKQNHSKISDFTKVEVPSQTSEQSKSFQLFNIFSITTIRIYIHHICLKILTKTSPMPGPQVMPGRAPPPAVRPLDFFENQF